MILRFTPYWNVLPCWYYSIQINSKHLAHLIAMFCFTAAFKCYKYKDLELHLVPFVAAESVLVQHERKHSEKCFFVLCLKATALIPAWSILAQHFSLFVHYQTDDWRCRKGVKRHISLWFCFHRDFSNGHHPANLNHQSQPFTISIFYTFFS